MKYVVTWFYSENSSEGGIYPQVKGKSSSKSFKIVYMRCLMTFFLSAAKANTDTKYILYSNKLEDELFETKREKRILHRLKDVGVEIRTKHYTYQPPEDQKLWRNQFYVLDVLTDMTSNSKSGDLIAILDSDVVWSGSSRTGEFWKELGESGILVMHPINSLEENINGYTQNDLADLSSMLDLDHSDYIRYCGGELIALNHENLTKCVRLSELVFPRYLQQLKLKSMNFIEEAHFLSIIYDSLGHRFSNGDQFIRRIWTNDWKYTNRERNDEQLILWHLPAEKKYGLKRLANLFLFTSRITWPTSKTISWRILLHITGVKKSRVKTFVDLIERYTQYLAHQLNID